MGSIISKLISSLSKTTEDNIKELENSSVSQDTINKELEKLNQLKEIEEQLNKTNTSNNLTSEQKKLNNQINSLNSEISTYQTKLTEIQTQRNESSSKLKTIVEKLRELESQKTTISTSLTELTNQKLELETQLKTLQEENSEEMTEELQTQIEELNEKISDLEVSISKLTTELTELEIEISSQKTTKNNYTEEDGNLFSSEKTIAEEIQNLLSELEKLTEEKSSLTEEIESTLLKLETEQKQREEELAKICKEALENLNEIQNSINSVTNSSVLDSLLSKLGLVSECNSDEYKTTKNNLINEIGVKKNSICENEIKELKTYLEKIEKISSKTELSELETEISKLTNCSNETKTKVLEDIQNIISVKRAYFTTLEKDTNVLLECKNTLSSDGLNVSLINETLLKALAISDYDSENIKKIKSEINELYNQAIIQEIEKVSNKVLSLDITEINDSERTLEENITNTLKKLQTVKISAQSYIKEIENIYASLPNDYQLSISSTDSLKPINNFIQQVDELIAGYSDDTTIYKAKELFALLTVGHGILGSDNSKSVNNSINTLLRSILSLETYKANLMFSELISILYPLELSTGPCYNEKTIFTDALLGNYIGVTKENFVIIENKDKLSISSVSSSTNFEDYNEYYLKDGVITGTSNSNNVLVVEKDNTNYINQYYITSPCGPIYLYIINNEVHSILYKNSIEAEIENVKVYKDGSKKYYNINGIWYNSDTNQTKCSEDLSIELTKKQISDSFYVTEELDVSVTRSDLNNETRYIYTIDRKNTSISGFREKIINYVNNLKNLIGTNSDYTTLKSKVESFLNTKTNTWEEFFKSGREILNNSPDYYWKLMERFVENSYPSNIWYNIPITFRLYNFKEELQTAISLLMTQIFVIVSGKANGGYDNVKCFKYLNPLSQFDRRCYMMFEEDNEYFGIKSSSINTVYGFTNSSVLIKTQPETKNNLISGTDIYKNQVKYLKYYFSEVNDYNSFPTITHMTPDYYDSKFVEDFTNKIVNGEFEDFEGNVKKIDSLVKLTNSQKIFTNMYGFMDFEDIVSQLYYDTIVKSLQFDLIFCFNNLNTSMSICHNDYNKGCQVNQLLPFVFSKPLTSEGKEETDSLFEF